MSGRGLKQERDNENCFRYASIVTLKYIFAALRITTPSVRRCRQVWGIQQISVSVIDGMIKQIMKTVLVHVGEIVF